jgi:neutral ceramidase
VGKQFAGEPDPAVVDWLVQQFSLAVEHAWRDLRPGEIGTGTFQAPDLVGNRLVGDLGTKDPDFVYMIAKQDSGGSAVLGAFDAHATTLGDWNMQVSGDYPGYWQRKMEKEGVDMAVFFAGSVGSHSPRSKGEKFEKPQYIGEALADSLLKHIPETGLQDSIVLESISLKMDLPEFHIRVSDEKRLIPFLGKRLFPDVGDAYLQGARIGHLIWITAPCDFSGEMAIRYKNAVAQNGYDAVITSFNGAYVGYIIPGKYYHLNKYESRLMSWFGPNMGPYFDEMITRITTQLTSRP